jgi:hypothetical protein
MLSYPIPEAEELLTNKLSAAQQSLSNSRCVQAVLPPLAHISVPDLLLPSSPFFFLPPFHFTLAYLLKRDCETDMPAPCTDNGSRHSARVQLGHRTKAQGGSRSGMNEESNESVP